MGEVTRRRSGVSAKTEERELLGLVMDGVMAAVLVLHVGRGGGLTCALANKLALESGLLVSPDYPGKPLAEVARAELCEALRAGYEESLATGGPYTGEAIVPLNGVDRWWLVRIVPTFDAEGRPVRLVAAVLDIDFVRELEEALRESEGRSRRIVSGVRSAHTELARLLEELRSGPLGDPLAERARGVAALEEALLALEAASAGSGAGDPPSSREPGE